MIPDAARRFVFDFYRRVGQVSAHLVFHITSHIIQHLAAHDVAHITACLAGNAFIIPGGVGIRTISCLDAVGLYSDLVIAHFVDDAVCALVEHIHSVIGNGTVLGCIGNVLSRLFCLCGTLTVFHEIHNALSRLIDGAGTIRVRNTGFFAIQRFGFSKESAFCLILKGNFVTGGSLVIDSGTFVIGNNPFCAVNSSIFLVACSSIDNRFRNLSLRHLPGSVFTYFVCNRLGSGIFNICRRVGQFFLCLIGDILGLIGDRTVVSSVGDICCRLGDASASFVGAVGNGGNEDSGILAHHGGIGAVGYGGTDLIYFLQVDGFIGSILDIGNGPIGQLGGGIGVSIGIDNAVSNFIFVIRNLGQYTGCCIFRVVAFIGQGLADFICGHAALADGIIIFRPCVAAVFVESRCTGLGFRPHCIHLQIHGLRLAAVNGGFVVLIQFAGECLGIEFAFYRKVAFHFCIALNSQGTANGSFASGFQGTSLDFSGFHCAGGPDKTVACIDITSVGTKCSTLGIDVAVADGSFAISQSTGSNLFGSGQICHLCIGFLYIGGRNYISITILGSLFCAVRCYCLSNLAISIHFRIVFLNYQSITITVGFHGMVYVVDSNFICVPIFCYHNYIGRAALLDICNICCHFTQNAASCE